MNEIPNESIRELAIHLANARAPSQQEIMDAMALAYQGGRIDGAIATADKIFKTMNSGKAA
jgi:hypothetical protein